MSRRNFVKTRNYDSPFGKRSIFYNVYDDPEGTVYKDDITEEEDKYTYTIIPCKSGLDVFEKQESSKYTPKPKQLFIFIEKKDSSKNNFFGTACRVKMGNKRREFLIELFRKQKQVSVNDAIQVSRNLTEWAEAIAYHSKGTDKEIEAKVLLNAVKLELSNQSESNQIFQTLFGLNDKLADWMRSGIGVMDKWKLTEENYEFAKYGKKLKPIIPVNIFTKSNSYNYTGQRDKTTLIDKGINHLIKLSDNLDEIIFDKAYVIALATPTVTDDILFGAVWIIKQFLEKELPEGIKNILKKVKNIINQAKAFIKKIGKAVQNAIALYNAFLCGLVNGLISLLQMVVWIVAFAIDNIPFLEMENFSKEKLAEHQKKIEFIEDLIDTIQINIKEIFEGLISSIKTLGHDISKFVSEVGKKITNLSKYFWAFATGAIVFELIIDAIFAFFTGGTSLVGSATKNISRLSKTLADKGLKVAKAGIKKIATSVSSLYATIKQLFQEIIEAIKSGKFIDWIKEQFLKLFEDTITLYDNLVSAIGKTERLKKSKSGIEVLCFVKGRVKIPVDKILKYCRGKVRNVENYNEILKEYNRLKAVKNKTIIQKKAFDIIENQEHNIRRSKDMRKILDDYGVPDTVEWNKKILDAISETANKELTNKYGGIRNRETIKIFFKTPKGTILFDTKWEKIGYAKQWMNTIIIKTLK